MYTQKIISNLLLCLLIARVAPVAAQQTDKLEITGGDTACKDAWFVGEFHNLKELAAMKSAFISYLYDKCDINTVVVEYGRSHAWLSNKYLETGDTTFFPGREHRYNNLLKNIRTINLTHTGKPLIRIYGMDFERSRFVQVLLHIMDHNNNKECLNTQLYTYLNNIPPATLYFLDSFGMRGNKTFRKTQKLYDGAQQVFEQEKTTLKAVLGADYYEIEYILTNPSTVNFHTRDKNMFLNLSEISRTHKRFICFAGKAHTNIEPDNPLVSRYIAANDPGKIAITTIIFPGQGEHYEYMGMPDAAAAENEENIALLHGKYKSTACSWKIIHASLLRDITAEDTRGTAMYYMYTDE